MKVVIKRAIHKTEGKKIKKKQRKNREKILEEKKLCDQNEAINKNAKCLEKGNFIKYLNETSCTYRVIPLVNFIYLDCTAVNFIRTRKRGEINNK